LLVLSFFQIDRIFSNNFQQGINTALVRVLSATLVLSAFCCGKCEAVRELYARERRERKREEQKVFYSLSEIIF